MVRGPPICLGGPLDLPGVREYPGVRRPDGAIPPLGLDRRPAWLHGRALRGRGQARENEGEEHPPAPSAARRRPDPVRDRFHGSGRYQLFRPMGDGRNEPTAGVDVELRRQLWVYVRASDLEPGIPLPMSSSDLVFWWLN